MHSRVSREDAEALGARSLRATLSADAALASRSTVDLLCPSADDVGAALQLGRGDTACALFELLEVAEVLQAPRMQFVLDFRRHPARSLLQPTLAQFQGPGLCAFIPDLVLTCGSSIMTCEGGLASDCTRTRTHAHTST